ncbi:O-antigen ligase family protein, partial [bacterium]|nr:O-antigen ligase family protein [bacterium]
SNSIQGLAIVMSGCATALIFDVRYKLGNWASVLFTCSAGLLGIFTFLGTAGLGPLIFLRQETVIFRIDYWRAGLKMSLAHPFFGVGIDSYGDFYQQYRSFEATYRTGPERVTNTAHNIFLDIASGSGLVAGLVFLSIFFILFVKAREVWHFETIDNSVITFISLGSGYLVFCLISINQIGIAVWGFLFLGVLHGLKVNHKESKKKPFQRQKKLEPESEYINRKLFAPQNYRTTIRVSLFAVFGLFLSLPPLIQDGKMLQAVRHLDFDKMKSIAYSDYSTVFHRNKYTDLLISQGKLSEATNFSIYEIARNDRDFYSLKVVAFSEYAPTSLRLDALKKLESFDPNNSEFLIELMKIRESLTSEIS